MTDDPYDAEYYEDLQSRMRALLISSGSLLTAKELGLFNELVDANECGVALDMWSESLASSSADVSEELLRDAEALAERMQLEPGVINRLQR